MVGKNIGVTDLSAWKLPSSISYLADSNKAQVLLSALRRGGTTLHCIRCDCIDISTINTRDSRELFRCRACGYIFGSLAGTIFHGTHLPLHKVIQYLVLDNAYGDAWPVTDICFVMGCAHKTANLWRTRVQHVRSLESFAVVDRELATSIAGNARVTEKHADDFFSYCGMRGIVVNEYLLGEYLRWVCQITMPDKVKTEVAKRTRNKAVSGKDLVT
jgi:transposase-like protein